MTSVNELSAKKIVLIIMYKAKGYGKFMGITRIEKLVYMLTRVPDFKEIEKSLNYEPLHFGPYSREVKNALEALVQSGFISTKDYRFNKQQVTLERGDEETEEELEENKEYVETVGYELTQKGEVVARRLLEVLSIQQMQSIDSITQQYGGLDLKELLKKVYKVAPNDLLSRSVIKDKLGC